MMHGARVATGERWPAELSFPSGVSGRYCLADVHSCSNIETWRVFLPESGEIELDKVREAIDEAVERDGGHLLRGIALSTALLAAIGAIASLLAGSTVNEALVLKSEATQLQAQASDQWSYYQAKGIKAAIAGSAVASFAAAGKAAPDSLVAIGTRQLREQREISDKARALEHERDIRDHEADILLARHHRFAYSVALLQVSIALGAVAALTRRKPVWAFSALIGTIGVGLLIVAMTRT